MNYYNEFDKGAAAWLRELIATGAIPKGEVDERSITDVTAGDLRGFTQCHFFAGIAGWPEALRRAGVPATRPLWTGSCPCQDYSCAGKGKGMEGKRDLWPKFFRLIRECRPVRVLGEQVSAAIGHGWLDRLSADMEAEGYAVGQVVLGAHSAGADHQRQRLYWVADSKRERLQRPVSVERPSCSTEKTQPVYRDSFADARLAMVGNISNLRPYDGFRIGVARSEIKGYGNAICVETARLFIEACEEVLSGSDSRGGFEP